MNRLIFVLAAGLACTACAASVEDAQPEPEQAEPQRDPPKTPFSGRFENPFDHLVGTVEDVRPDLEAPLLLPPRFPDPDPNAEP